MTINFEPIQINMAVTKRNSSWVQVCPECQNERYITYAQAWNIKKGNSNKECRNCLLVLGKITYNITGLQLGRKYNKKTNKIKNLGTTYRNIFNNCSQYPHVKQKMRNAKLGKIGELAGRWQGGKTKETLLLRSRDEYKQLRNNVFKRDNYTCQVCFTTKTYLEMHHIKEWSNYPDLRFVLENCITLCKPCHKLTDNYAYKAIKRML